MLSEELPLELDESELFEDDQSGELATSRAAPLGLEAKLNAALQAGSAGVAPQPQSDGESESDDDGIVLESECSSSEADEVEAELVSRIQSLQSSLEIAAPAGQGQGADKMAYPHVVLGSSHASQVGSLKSFGSYYKGKRLFGSDGDLAASMPVTTPMHAGRRKTAAADPASRGCNLGTSMPICIPLMQRRNSSADLLDEVRGQAATFVPPHMLHRQDSSEAGVSMEPSLGLSPSTGARRERLLARNAILRSTGFIEVHQGPAAVIGEVLDPVKEQLLAPTTTAMAMLGMRGEGLMRAPPRSSLTQLLGTSK